MKILHLPINKKWLDMIASGEKKEEYREIKPHWQSRIDNKEYTHVLFRNGYATDAPKLLVEVENIGKAYGYSPWGAPKDEVVYVISLGEIIKGDL